MTTNGGSAMKNHRHQVISLLAAAGSRSCTTRPVNVPVWNSSPSWRNVKNVISPTAAAPGLRGAKPMASVIPRAIGTPRAIRVEPLVEPGAHQDARQAEDHALGDEPGRQALERQQHEPEHEARAGHRDAHREEREDHEPGGRREAAEDVRGRHQAGQDEGQRQEQHDDVVGEHVRHEQRHGRDDGPERDEAAPLEPVRQGQDPSQPEDHERREGAQRAHGREPAGEPPEERRRALAAAGRRRLRGGRHPLG